MTRGSWSALAMATAVAAGMFGTSAPALAWVCVTPPGATMKPAPTYNIPARFGSGSFAGTAADRGGQLGGIIPIRGGGGHGGCAGHGHGHGGGGGHWLFERSASIVTLTASPWPQQPVR